MRPVSFAVAATILLCAISGCGKSTSYPQAEAARAVGRSARCDFCGKEIPSVAKEHLFEFEGVQYTVCSEACKDELAKAIPLGKLESEEHQH